MQAIFEKKEYFQLSASNVAGFKGYMSMFHPHGELIYITKGAVPITVDGKSHLLQEGEMAVLFPYLTHAYEDSPEASALIVLFDPRETAFDNTLLSFKPDCCHTQAAFLAPLMERAVEMTKRNRPKTAMSYVNAVLGELLELLDLVPHDGPSGDMTVQVLSYCAEHFTEDITVSSLASALYISESYVSKLFSRHFGCSFREHINGLRIHKAQNLLETTELPISTVMARCGFQNQSTFNRTFRDITGLSPRAYRRR
ncbi:MAG: helix-turn-helix transcriptional regulator [Oscillospiraceae bacterium]|nr:helix-turn-helix transcriptional regulator [Oscillospiraceae bacterium]